MSEQVTLEERFVGGLISLVDKRDRAALAALRQALGTPPGSRAEAARVVYRLLPLNLPKRRERDFWLIAGLFAMHPHQPSKINGKRYGPSLANSLRTLARREGVSDEGVERRLTTVLNAEREDLDDHLRHAVAQLRGFDIGVDYVQLLRDLRAWNAEQRWVQRRWAMDFWGQSSNHAQNSTTEGEVA
jgi:CRISPR system Cascade subunit CasB